MNLSKKQSRLLPLLSIAAAMFFVYSSGAWAYCKFYSADPDGPTGQTATLGFGRDLTAGLTIPRDAPIGTVIYRDSGIVPLDVFYGCSKGFQYGFYLDSALGSIIAENEQIFPLGKTGLSFKIRSSGSGAGYLSTPFWWYPPSSFFLRSASYTLEIIKSGELASQNKVPAGALGELRGGDLPLIKFNLLNPITPNTGSCQTPSVPVQMGDDYQLQDFRDVGATPRVIKFNIALNQCQRGIQKVTYQLKATTQVLDANKGVVALSAGSTAKGIGLQLMNDAGQPIALDTTYPFNGFNSTGTDFKIPLSAAYYRLANGKLEAGTANTEVSFIMSYL